MSWLDKFFTGGIKNVAIAGTLLPQEVTLNFASGATGVDNPGLSRSDVTISVLATPTGTGFVHITGGAVDAAARAVNLSGVDITSVLGVTNGGTGLSTGGSANQVLTWVSGAPAWAANAAVVTWASDLGNSTNSNQWIASISGSSGTVTSVSIQGSVKTLQWIAGIANPTITILAPASDVATTDLHIVSQPPIANAVTNKNSGNVVVDLSAPVAGGVPGLFKVTVSGAAQCSIGNISGSSAGYVWLGPNTPTTTNYVYFCDGSLTQIEAPSTNLILGTNGGQAIQITDGSGSNVMCIGSRFTGIEQATAHLSFSKTLTNPTININAKTSDAATQTLSITGQSAFSTASTNVNGGFLLLQGGAAKTNGTTGLRGGVRLQAGADSAETLVEVTEPVVGQRVIALCQIGSGISSTQMPVNSGDGVIFLANANVAPTASSQNTGIILYATNANAVPQLFSRDSGGTVSQLTPRGITVTLANGTASWTSPITGWVALTWAGGGGGGCGGAGSNTTQAPGGGGGGGAQRITKIVQVTAGQQYDLIYGAGGGGGTAGASGGQNRGGAGSVGGDSTFTIHAGAVLATWPGANGAPTSGAIGDTVAFSLGGTDNRTAFQPGGSNADTSNYQLSGWGGSGGTAGVSKIGAPNLDNSFNGGSGGAGVGGGGGGGGGATGTGGAGGATGAAGSNAAANTSAGGGGGGGGNNAAGTAGGNGGSAGSLIIQY